jgi:thiamine biosynthesis lipoprotein
MPGINRVVAILIAILIASTTISGCSQPGTEPLQKSQLLALGTLVDISLWDTDATQASEAIHAIDTRLDEIYHNWHGWLPGRLHDINTAIAQDQDITLNDTELELLQQASQLAAQSQQLFNPAIGRLIGQWGFHSDTPEGPPPAADVIQKLLARQPRMSNLSFSGHTLHSNNNAVQLDVGAFAKGYAVDQAIALLRQHGVNNAIINIGGDLRAIGRHGKRPWHIGIRHPEQPGVIAALEIQGDESVFTSGNYERFYEYEGQRYHHIIDPRNGYPSRETLSVTVIHRNAATADAAATALLVAGPHQWRRMAMQMGIDQAMLIDNQLTVHMTSAMAQRVQLNKDLKTVIEEIP